MDNSKFSQQCLTAINKYRQLHQVSPLTLNPEISRISQEWADQLAAKNSFGHNSNASYRGIQLGENCAMNYRSDGTDYTGDQAAAQWYEEIANYDFCSHRGSRTGHFTQLVWKGSHECGLGRSRTRDGKWLVVANFFPPGNYIGEDSNNVFPPTSACDSGNSDYAQKLAGSGVGDSKDISSYSADRKPYLDKSEPQTTTEVHEETIGSVTKLVTIETKTFPDGHTERKRSEKIKDLGGIGNNFGGAEFQSPFKDSDWNSFSSKNFPSRNSQQTNIFPPSSGYPSNFGFSSGFSSDFGFPSSSGFSSSTSNSSSSGGAKVRREVSEETSGSGPNAVTKVVTIETTTHPDGRVETKRSEQIKSGTTTTSTGSGFGKSRFGF